jgi:hypothetical protein
MGAALLEDGIAELRDALVRRDPVVVAGSEDCALVSGRTDRVMRESDQST